MDSIYDSRIGAANANNEIALPVSPNASNLQSVIKRIRECVEMETKAIQSDSSYDAKQLNSRKSRLLYELGRAGKNIDMAHVDDECRGDFSELRKALAENASVLKAHISAVSEVASIVQNAIDRDETDGTYTAGELAEHHSA